MKKNRIFWFILFIFNIDSSISNDFIMVTTYHNKERSFRVAEIKKCFKENIKNNKIKKIIVFLEGFESEKIPEFLLHKKIIIEKIKSRPSFNFLLDFINKNLINQKIILSNSDIFFDKSLSFNEDRKTFYCLTRHNFFDTGWKRHSLSFDTWIFISPVHIDIEDEYHLGELGSDIAFSYCASKSGLNIKNPSLSLICWHYDSVKSIEKKYLNDEQYCRFMMNRKRVREAQYYFKYNPLYFSFK